MLKVLVNTRIPFLQVNQTPEGKYIVTGGIEKDVFNMVLYHIGRPYEIMFFDVKNASHVKANDNSLDTYKFVELVEQGEIDMIFPAYTIEEKRLELVDYCFPTFIYHTMFGTTKPGLLPKAQAFLRPFSLEIWIYILMTVAVLPFMFRFIFSRKKRLSTCVLKIISALLNQGLDIPSHYFRENILVASWLIVTFFISVIYSSLLLSFLTLPVREPSVRTPEQLSKVILEGSFQCYAYHGSTVTLLRESQDEHLQIIGNYIDENNNYIGYDDTMISQKRKNVAFISHERAISFVLGQEAQFSDDTLNMVMAGIVIRKSFPLRDRIDTMIHRMWATGTINKLCDDFFYQILYKAFSREDTNEEEEVKPLSLSDLNGVFLSLVIGHTLALVILFFEIYYEKIIELIGTLI